MTCLIYLVREGAELDRTEEFRRVFFPESVLREAVDVMKSQVRGTGKDQPEPVVTWGNPSLTDKTVQWAFDSDIEFFAEYGPHVSGIHMMIDVYERTDERGWPVNRVLYLWITYSHGVWSIKVSSSKREQILATFAVFNKAFEKHKLPAPPPPPMPPLKVFIGHGRSHHWRDLKDALQDHHGFDVEAFETQPRAGYNISEVIEGMAQNNSLALIVMSAEDEQKDGSVRARENVVHEVGYFQGRLGRKRAILIMENGVNEFSNIHGIVHLPYTNIREVVGDVLAIIKREFPYLSS